MSERGTQLARTAGRQIGELTEILSTCGETALRLPCPGREKLGDGTVGALTQHTTEKYHRIAAITRHANTRDSAGHSHETAYSADNVRLSALLAQLSAARDAVARLAYIEDDKLDSVPAAGALRFADGQPSSRYSPPRSSIKPARLLR